MLILQKPYPQRTLFDIKMLIKCTESVKFFADMLLINDYTTHDRCCRVMTHEFYHAGEILFRAGAEGTTFYIILKGSVGVYIPERRRSISKINQENSPKNSQKNSIKNSENFIEESHKNMMKSTIISSPMGNVSIQQGNSSFKLRLLKANSIVDDNYMKEFANTKGNLEEKQKNLNNIKKNSKEINEKNLNYSHKIEIIEKNSNKSTKNREIIERNLSFSSKFKEIILKEKIGEGEGQRVKVMVQGQSFGELALLDNKPRAATIICEEDCHFAVLEKINFTEILSFFINFFFFY